MTKEEALSIIEDSGYTRIATKINFMWGAPELDTYFKELIISDREGRQGFSTEVFEALVKLSNIHNGISDLRIVKR
jgi:hypothetical protein